VYAQLTVLLLTVPPLHLFLPDFGINAAALTATFGNLFLVTILLIYYRKRFAASLTDLLVLQKSDLRVRFRTDI